jgi:hypothetical protein
VQLVKKKRSEERLDSGVHWYVNADLYFTVLFTKNCVIGRDRNSVHECPRFVLAFILQ